MHSCILGEGMNLTTKQIEDKFDITRQTLHNWIKEGILPAPKKDFRNWNRNRLFI